MIAHVMDAGPASHVAAKGGYAVNTQPIRSNNSKSQMPASTGCPRMPRITALPTQVEAGKATSAAAPRTHDIAKSSHYSGTLPAAITGHRHERMTRATHVMQLQCEPRATAFHNGRLERYQQGAPLATPLPKKRVCGPIVWSGGIRGTAAAADVQSSMDKLCRRCER